ncbi:hypothetical protein BLNAU_17826 [Blattamonas nauphoetae]|uniref:UBA domain-containing protein n=1 Tax=Blattamonas nauphoetae TaxID=2049346 RepID=A0ABQ9X6D6_9EUKA|nr:hypothetical protein BLNAU_17826 [Blattamonas nauphoetae]
MSDLTSVQRLEKLGYTTESAEEALLLVDGDFEAAAAYLKETQPEVTRKNPVIDAITKNRYFPQLKELVKNRPEAVKDIANALGKDNRDMEALINYHWARFEGILKGTIIVQDTDDDERLIDVQPQQQTWTAQDDANVSQIMEITGATKEAAEKAYRQSNRQPEAAVNRIFGD